MMEETIEDRGKRPVFLLVLCILSFVYIGFSIASGLFFLSLGPSSDADMQREVARLDKQMEQMKDDGMGSWVPTFEKMKSFTIESNKKFYGIQIVSILVLTVGLFAVIKMFTGYKIGFHLYIIYSLLGIGQVYFFVSPAIVPLFVIIFHFILSGIFVAMYAANLRWLR